MCQILKKEVLCPDTKLIEIEAPLIAGHCKPGQFVVLRIDEKGERIPLTLYDFDRDRGTITLVFLEVGKTTKKLGMLKKGDEIRDVLGPLGKPFEIKDYGTVVCVGGGLGIPAIYPVARGLKESGNRVISIIGARCKELLILEGEMSKISDEVHVTTDDGSYGIKGFVTYALEDVIEKSNLVFAVGPLQMMKAVCELTGGKVKTIVSLNPIMVDGTGMCGTCRVRIDNEIKFACVDGPDFDGHSVDFDELITRNRTYLDEEKTSLETCEKCRE